MPNCWPLPQVALNRHGRRVGRPRTRCSLTRATSCTSSAAACATRCWAASAPIWTSPPTPGPSRCSAVAAAVGRRAVGHRHRVRHGRRRQEAATGVEITTFRADTVRPGVAQPGGAVRRAPRRRSGAPRLHRQRDGGAHHAPTVRANSLIRWAVWRRCAPACWTRRRRRRCRSATIRCGCCGRRGSSRSWSSPSRRGCLRRWLRWRRNSGRITAERVAAELDKLLLGAEPGRPASI